MRLIFILFFTIFFSNSAIANYKYDKYVLNLIDLATKNADRNSTKSIKYIEKAFEYKSKINESILLKLYECAGKVYRTQDEFYISLKYYNEQLELQKKINPKDIYFIYNDIGTVYYRLGNLKKAREYYDIALEGLKKTDNKSFQQQIYNVYNNLGILEQKEGNIIKSLEIFTKCKEICKESNDIQGLIMAYQNIAIANLELKDYAPALHDLHKAKYLARKHKYNFDLSSIIYNIGYAYNHNIINPDSAKYYFHQSFELGQKHQFSIIKKASSEELIEIYEKEKNYEKVAFYLHIAKDLNEENITQRNQKKIDQLEFSYQQKIREQNIIAENKKKTILLIISSILLLSICVIIFLKYQLQKNKLKIRTTENMLLAKQLEERNKELTGKAIQILQTKETIDATHKELTELKENSDTATKKMLSKIISELRTETKGFNKSEFEKIFMETHQDFYKNLLRSFPNITRNELRLCAFLKMNLSTKEIASITQQSQNSIVIARHRLRKKVNLNNEKQSLTNFLNQF